MTDETPAMVQPAPMDLQETAPEPPKRRGRPPGSKNKTTGRRRGRKKSLEDSIGGVLMLVNLGFAFAPEEFQGDALDMVEISALSKALDEAAKENATLYKYLDAVLGGSGSAMVNLAVVAACIAARRMARHDVLVSPDWDERIGAFVGMTTGDSPSPVDFANMFSGSPAEARPETGSDDTSQTD